MYSGFNNPMTLYSSNTSFPKVSSKTFALGTPLSGGSDGMSNCLDLRYRHMQLCCQLHKFCVAHSPGPDCKYQSRLTHAVKQASRRSYLSGKMRVRTRYCHLETSSPSPPQLLGPDYPALSCQTIPFSTHGIFTDVASVPEHSTNHLISLEPTGQIFKEGASCPC